MNSVIQIGDNIIFINEGELTWSGDKVSILKSENKLLNKFVFASELYKKLRP